MATLPNSSVSKSSRELLAAQAHVWNQIFNFINSMCLKCAIQLHIPDLIHRHGNPMSLSQLADAISIDRANKSQALSRLMRILTHSKFFSISSENEECYYSLTPASTLLLTDNPLSMAPLAVSMLEPTLIDLWNGMGEWFLNDNGGPTPFFSRYGMTLWDLIGSMDEKGSSTFNEAMACDARLVAGLLTGECREVFEGLRSVVDVAGGTGMLARGIASAFPEMECVVLDFPRIVAGMEGGRNLKYVSGDIFESIPNADALLLKWILHDWNDEECVKILKKCKEAIIPSKNNGGKLIIIEMIVGEKNEEHEEAETKLFYDLMMMVYLNGKERTEKEFAKLFFAAGFSSYKITATLGLRSIIEVFP